MQFGRRHGYMQQQAHMSIRKEAPMDSVTERNTVNVIFRHHGDIESNTPTQKGTLERP